MFIRLFSILVVLVVFPNQTPIVAQNPQYTADWDSLDSRPLPQWYDDAKFGVFMHWGLYSVPSLQSEWFWYNWENGNEYLTEYMNNNYKPGFKYADFAPSFTADLFNETEFANIISNSGAKYFVLTSKHHEGFTMWPSNYSWNWNSFDVGPHKDLVGALANSVRDQGVRFGLYFSLMDWYHPLYLRDQSNSYATQEYVEEVMNPQIREIINTYLPEVLWNDGDWEAPSEYWNATETIAWLYNDSPVKDTIVTNDRWGYDAECQHGGFYTCGDKFNPGTLQTHKWENCMTIDRQSWGYRRDASLYDFLSIEELIESLATTISCGGNLLLNVGPTYYGKITPIFEERLTQIGQWLEVNGEAVYGSKPWVYQNDSLTPDVWYTSKLRNDDGSAPKRRVFNPQNEDDTVVYAFVLNWPQDNQLQLASANPTDKTKVSLLGYDGKLPAKQLYPTGLTIDFSGIQWTKLPNTWSWVLKLEYLETDTLIPDIKKPQKPKVVTIERTRT